MLSNGGRVALSQNQKAASDLTGMNAIELSPLSVATSFGGA